MNRFLPWCVPAFFLACGLGEGVAQVTLGLILAALLYRFRDAVRVARTLPVTYALTAFIIWAIATMGASQYGWPKSAEGLKLFNLLPLVAVPTALALYPQGRPYAARALIGGLFAAALFGFIQYRFGVHWGATFLHVREERWALPSTPDRFSALGFFFNRIKFAHALVVGLALCLLVPQPRRPWVRVIVAAVLALALLLTFVRAAALALLVGLLVAALVRRRFVKQIAALLLLGALTVAAVPSLRHRISTVASLDTYSDRLFLWARANEMRQDHPLLGVGYGDYARACGPYYDRVDPSFPMRTEAHNQWLTLLVEGGPLLVLLWILLWVQLWRGLKKDGEGAAGAAVWVAVGVLSLVHDPFYLPANALVICACMGLATTVVERREAQ